MVRIKNVLCPVDFSPVSQRAVDYAVKLAQRFKSRLHLIHVVAPVVPGLYVDATRIEATIKKQVDREMPKLVAAARRSGVDAKSSVRTGEIEKEIQIIARAVKADVIVVGKHARRTVERWFIGSITDRLLRRTVKPLLIIGEAKRKRWNPSTIRRLVVTTDFSDNSDDAFEYALSFAQGIAAHLTFLHVITPIPAIITPPLVPMAVEPPPSADQLRTELENRLPANARQRVSLETRVETGEPYREILNVLEEIRADLLVMNIHGKSRIERALIGSTAERVIRGAPCPVMAIPPIRRRAA